MMREAAELSASEESARWFRKIDLLNVIGNLGPLVGLAGTVWGMILAFTSLGDSGGNAGPAQLSLGISKALFHTLLGLCVAIPCLAAYGVYRGIVDRLCTRGIVMASDILEAIAKERKADS
jgi:biopolymer transport protein ExbB/TolQ